LAKRHLAYRHLAYRHLAKIPLAKIHLAKIHLTERHFFGALFGQHLTLSVGQPFSCVEFVRWQNVIWPSGF
jgi:hypothetical protein